MNSQLKNTNGVTMIEVLVTAIIGAVVAAAVVVFVNISGTATDEMAGMQVLQQESSMISELFLRTVRSGRRVGKFVTKDSCLVPGNDTLITDEILIIYPNPNNNIQIKISGNKMEMIKANGTTKNVSTRLCTTEDPSTFTIQPYGEGIRLALTLEYARKEKTHTYTTTIGSVRCKNGP